MCVRKKSRWIDWADLLKRVFAIEVLVLRLAMDVCGGRRRVLAVIKDEHVARKILEHFGPPRHELSTRCSSPYGWLIEKKLLCDPWHVPILRQCDERDEKVRGGLT